MATQDMTKEQVQTLVAGATLMKKGDGRLVYYSEKKNQTFIITRGEGGKARVLTMSGCVCE